MRSINKVILIGNLTRDPELRQTPNGQNVVTFGLATNREWSTRDGRKQSLAEFHDLVAWAKLADVCTKYLRKGKLIYVEGYLKTRSWDSPEGIKKFKTEIVVQDMIMLDKRQAGEGDEFVPEDTEMSDTHEQSEGHNHTRAKASVTTLGAAVADPAEAEATTLSSRGSDNIIPATVAAVTDPAATEKPRKIRPVEKKVEMDTVSDTTTTANNPPVNAGTTAGAGTGSINIDDDLGL